MNRNVASPPPTPYILSHLKKNRKTEIGYEINTRVNELNPDEQRNKAETSVSFYCFSISRFENDIIIHNVATCLVCKVLSYVLLMLN